MAYQGIGEDNGEMDSHEEAPITKDWLMKAFYYLILFSN